MSRLFPSGDRTGAGDGKTSGAGGGGVAVLARRRRVLVEGGYTAAQADDFNARRAEALAGYRQLLEQTRWETLTYNLTVPDSLQRRLPKINEAMSRVETAVPFLPPPVTPTPALDSRPSPRVANPLINRDFGWLLTGQAVSGVGDVFFDTTVVLWVARQLAAGQSWAPLAVSAVFAAAIIPSFLVGPWSGVLVDRWPKRRTMLWTDAIRSLAVVALIVAGGVLPLPLPLSGHLPLFARLTAVYTAVVLVAAGAAFFRPARVSLINVVVPAGVRAQAASTQQAASNVVNLLGPPVATALFFVNGPSMALGIDALSFVISFLAIARLPVSRDVVTESRRVGFLPEIADSYRYFIHNRVLVVTTVGGLAILATYGAINALGIYFLQQNLHASLRLYGFLGTATAAGLLVGTLVAAVFVRRIGPSRTYVLSIFGIGILTVAYARSTSFLPAVILLMLLSIPKAAVQVPAAAMILRATPRDMVGRIFAIFVPILDLDALLSVALSGYLASTALRGFHARLASIQFGPIDTIFTIGGLAILATGVYAAFALRGHSGRGAEGTREA